MKKAKRIIGMVLLIVGGFLTVADLIALWAVLTVRDVDYRLGSAVMALIFILFSAGLFMLGWRLRHPRNKASDPAQKRPAPAKPALARAGGSDEKSAHGGFGTQEGYRPGGGGAYRPVGERTGGRLCHRALLSDPRGG